MVPTLCNILTGDQLAQLGLVWITLYIRSCCVYHHIHYCRGSHGHCVEICFSGEAKRRKYMATVGLAAGLIWKDCCNYESPEKLAVWQVQRVNTVLTVRKVPWPPPPQQSKTLSWINIFNLLGSIQHLSTKKVMLAGTNMYKLKVKLCGHDRFLCPIFCSAIMNRNGGLLLRYNLIKLFLQISLAIDTQAAYTAKTNATYIMF